MLTVNNVSFAYEGFTLTDISFQLNNGEVLAILGANGSGKSTFIKCLMKVLSFEGDIVFDKTSDYIGHVSYTPDKFPFGDFYWQSISDLYSINYKGFSKDVFSNTLSRFNIKNDLLLSNLSSGEQQKFMLALAIANPARLYILDEPSDSIDPFTRELMVENLLDHIIDTSINTIITTHNVEPYENMIDKVVILSKGKLLISDSKENIMSNGNVYLKDLGFSSDEINLFLHEPTLRTFMQILQEGGF